MKPKMKQKFKPKNNDESNGGEFMDEYSESTKWYDEIATDPSKFEPVTDQVLIELKDEAKKCLDSDSATFNIKNQSSPDFRWMKTVLTKGIVSDKIAAYTILVQNKAVFSLETVRNLVSMVKVGKKKECVAVIETLTELFLNDLLRPNVKLKPFHQRPLSLLNELSSGNAITRRKYLNYWYFEDQLKECYTTYVQALNTAAHDTVESNKEKAIGAMTKLLMGNPEQEGNLLRNIVNKLGDPSQKIASKTIYCLTQLLNKHSNMQGVVLSEVEKLLFRPNIGAKAQYYSLCFLSQFYLNHEQPQVARKLIEVYFSFFKKSIKESDVDSRMMSALLIGVNRAYPYAKLELEKISEHINTIYKIVHVASFSISLHALSLLYQVSEFSNTFNDRYYTALYKKLLDPKLLLSTHQAILLNLVYKSLLRDPERNRVLAFMKRLLQLCMYVQPNFACGILYLVSQIIHKKKNVDALTLEACAAPIDGDDDDEEKYVDIKKETEEKNIDCEEDKEHELSVLNADGDKKKIGSWNHCKTPKFKNRSVFDPTTRNPLYSGAEHSAYVELIELKKYFHPSVALFAEKILGGEKIVYSGDPLKDFTLIRFLERFVYKNPKKFADLKTASSSTFGKRDLYVAKGIRSLPVMSREYLNQQEENIPVEEKFLFRYLQKRYKDKVIKDEDESDNDSVNSEEFEEMLDKMAGFKEGEDDEEELDYMNDVATTKKTKKDKVAIEVDDDEDAGSDNDDMEDDDGPSDGELLSDDGDPAEANGRDGDDDDLMEDGDEDLLDGLDDDDDASDLAFDDDDDDEDMLSDEEAGPSMPQKKKLKSNKLDYGSIFASAEEFASILDDEGTSKKRPGGSGAFANKDKAGVKQLDWEEKRNHWLQGYNTALGKKGKGFKDKKRKFTGNKPNKAKPGGFKKKQKQF